MTPAMHLAAGAVTGVGRDGSCVEAITLAVMARAAPQLNIYSVGFTLQVMVVLFGGLFLLPEIVLMMNAVGYRVRDMLPGLV